MSHFGLAPLHARRKFVSVPLLSDLLQPFSSLFVCVFALSATHPHLYTATYLFLLAPLCPSFILSPCCIVSCSPAVVFANIRNTTTSLGLIGPFSPLARRSVGICRGQLGQTAQHSGHGGTTTFSRVGTALHIRFVLSHLGSLSYAKPSQRLDIELPQKFCFQWQPGLSAIDRTVD